jgi:aspartate 1-decarboxylase
VDYEGSITVPPALMSAADLLPFEAVNVWNVSQGTRFETYAIEGLPGSLDICVNGAAAHLVKPGDKVIIASFIDLPESVARRHQPTIVFVNDDNSQRFDYGEKGVEIPGPQRREEKKVIYT